MIEIGPHQFPTRTAAKAHIRALLARYAPGDLVKGADHDALLELTLRHPRANEKVGAGVDRFRVVQGPYRRSRAFEILRTDGSWTEVSFPKCVDGDPPHRTLVLRALRLFVEPDVNALRQRLFREMIGADGCLPCELTGERLLPNAGRLDHIAPHTFSTSIRSGSIRPGTGSSAGGCSTRGSRTFSGRSTRGQPGSGSSLRGRTCRSAAASLMRGTGYNTAKKDYSICLSP